MIKQYSWLLSLLLATVVGCTPLAIQPMQTPSLIAPVLLREAVQVTQQVDIQWQDKNHQMLVVWSQQDGLFQVVGLTAAGQMLFRADFDGLDYHQQTFVAELQRFNLKQLLRHIQIAYWPEESVAALLRDQGQQLQVAQGQRLVLRSGELVARYAFSQPQGFSSLVIHAPSQPSLSVETLTVQGLDAGQRVH